MKLQFYDIAKIVAGFQFLLVSIFLIAHKDERRISHKILAVFLLSKTFAIVESTLLTFKAALIDFPHIFCIARSTVFLFGPALYCYAKSMTLRNFRFKKYHLFHLLPFVAFCIFLIFKFHIQSFDIKQQLILQRYLYSYSEALFIFGFLHLQILAYIIAALIILKNYRSDIKKVYSSIERINLSWLYLIQFGFILIWCYDFVNSYRIEEAKQHLANHAINKKNVLEILYEVGFNSKSSFNNVFKKYTGMTPTEFKRLNSKNNRN